MRTIELDLTILSASGKPLRMVISGDESLAADITDLAENAQEYIDWVKSERMGISVSGMVN